MPEPTVPYQPQPPLSPADERQWSMLIHLGGIIFGFLPSLIGYLVLKDRGAYIREQTKTALNFQITMTIAYAVGLILMIVFIGILVVMAVGIVVIIFSIIAAIAANKGEPYTYPVAFTFIK